MKSLALAATIILMRETSEGPPELLMLERAATMAFAAGALVFPGGRVDPQDFTLAAQLGLAEDIEETAQRIAAIRETIEEAGIAVGLRPVPDPAALGALRQGLSENRPFPALLNELDLKLDLEALSPFARWQPAEDVARRFDTRFYLAAVPPDAAVQADGGENVRALWATALALLEDDEKGRHRVIFPTWCNLDRLAQFASLEEARSDGALHAHHIAAGRVEMREGTQWYCIDEGIGYPTTARPLKPELRG